MVSLFSDKLAFRLDFFFDFAHTIIHVKYAF